MKLDSLQIITTLSMASVALAKSYILYFEQGPTTPNSYVTAAKDKVLELGGTIGHEYSTVLTGFSFSIPDTVSISTVESSNNKDYPFILEEDSQVYTQDA